MFQIICGHCGKANEFDLWMTTASGMKLPKGVYQCPACKVAIKKTFGPPTIYEAENGEPALVIPGKAKLERVQPWL
ncbi:hypothetical protein ACUUL3_04750 [Thiovibrio sp. JS02]